MSRVWAIAINTFREAVRDKVLYGVLGFASFVLVFTLLLAELSLNQQRRVVLDVGLASISIFSVIIAVFLGSSLLYKEIERKTLYVILPKPIHRWEFLIGKYVGVVVTAVVFVAIMGTIQLFVTSIQAGASVLLLVAVGVAALAVLGLAMWKGRDRTAAMLPWSFASLAAAAAVAFSAEVDVAAILSALSLIVGEVVVLSAIAMFFSSFSTPFLTGTLTFGVFLVGRSADEMTDMRSQALPDVVVELLHELARVVPNLHLFYPGWKALSGETPIEGGLGSYLMTTHAYGVVYAAILLVAAIVVFRRRDFL